MKHIKLILLTLLLSAGFFSTVIFTACTKVSCSNVVCKNGGACSNGVCSCPTGYSGTFCESIVTTAIVYKNNTFTPITISVNDLGKTIPVGGSVSFTGKYGTDAIGTATTSGSATSLGISTAGGVIGLPINWSISNTFPVSDTLRVPLDVGATYFFLRMTNKSDKNIIDYYVNYKFPYGESYEDVTIPNDSKQYDLGYYLAYQYSNVQTQSVNAKINYFTLSLPGVSNQSASVTINN